VTSQKTNAEEINRRFALFMVEAKEILNCPSPFYYDYLGK